MAYIPTATASRVGGIQGQSLQINIVGCRHLADKEWFSRQDPYVMVEYASNRFKTRTDTDGGKNPTFNEKFTISLIEGLREVEVQVWNSNTVSTDDFIGSARVLLDKVLSSGYDDSSWGLKSKHGKSAGEVNLILHYANSKAGKGDKMQGYASGYPPSQGAYPSSVYPPASPSGYPHGPPSGYHSTHGPPGGYPPAPGGPTGYPPSASGYPGQSYQSVPSGYPPAGYPPAASGYPPPPSSHGAPYSTPSVYPPSGYPPSGHQPPGSQHYPAPGGYPGAPPPVYGVPPGGYPGYNPSL